MFLFLTLFSSNLAFAHAVVKPNIAGIAAYQVFTVSVPSEKDVATTGVRLVLPEGLESITPTVKPGWIIDIITEKTGKTVKNDNEMDTPEYKPKEITWTAGVIPPHLRDEFTFQVKLPSKVATLAWKVYQTYKDGSVVAWELSPTDSQSKGQAGKSDFSKFGPYSTTKVLDDLANTKVVAENPKEELKQDPKGYRLSIILSTVAIVLAGWSIMKKVK